MFRKKSLRGIERLENKALLACDMTFAGGLLDIQCDGADDVVNVFGDDGVLTVDVDGTGLVPIGAVEDLSELNIQSGGGADNVTLTQVSADKIRVNTGQGDDDVKLSLIDTDKLDIKTGQGDDLVAFLFGNVADSVKVKTGGGDDTVQVLPFFVGLAADNVSIDGQSGDDTFEGEGNIVATGNVNLKNFETFDPGFPGFPF